MRHKTCCSCFLVCFVLLLLLLLFWGEVDRQEFFANAEWLPGKQTRTFKDIRYKGMI